MGKRFVQNFWVFLLITFGWVFILNYFSYKVFGRLDLTEGKAYTLGESTKQILSAMEDPITIKAYLSSNLPVPLSNRAREIQDLLEEYKIYGKGKIKLSIIDPSRDERLADELRDRGIFPTQFQVRGTTEFAIREGFLALEVQYLDQRKVFNNLLDLENFEYSLTSTLYKLSKPEEKKIGFLTGHEEKDPYKELSALRELIESQYKITMVDLKGGASVPDDVGLLLVIGPNRLSEREKYEIDQFVMRGGKLILLVDGVMIAPEYMVAFPNDDNLDDLLNNYHIKREHNLVMDVLHERVSFRTKGAMLITPYPLFVKVNFSALKELGTPVEHPIVNQLDSVVLPWCSSLTFDGSKDVQAVELLKTTPKSWVQTGQFQLDPSHLPPPLPVANMGEATRSLGIMVSGKFKSLYAGKDIPKPEDGETAEAETQQRADESKETSILVVGNSRFVEDDYVRFGSSNLDFIVNAIDWMTIGGKLIGIRSRVAMDRPLRHGSSPLRIYLVGLVSPFLVPVIIVVYGVVRFQFRKKEKRTYAQAIKLGEGEK